MPFINYKCAEGHVSKKLIIGGKEIPEEIVCREEDCELPAKRILGAPSSNSTYTIKQGDLADVEVSHTTLEEERDKIDKGYTNHDDKLRKLY